MNYSPIPHHPECKCGVCTCGACECDACEQYRHDLEKAIRNANESKGPVYIEHPIVGVKADFSKVRYSLLPWASVLEVVKVLEFGAAKYAEDNWQKVPDASRRYFDAAMRHMVAWREGEKLDPESGFHHLAHATCCLLFMLWFEVKP